MKKILRIARVELSLLFYSPIAWLVLIIFIIQCGITYIGLINERQTSQQLGNELKSLTIDIFGGKYGFFTAVKSKLFLYIPLLTMGLLSRETSSGSIKLLLSSPVTISEIVMGKFLAMMAYGFLLISVLLVILICGSISIESLDIKFVLGGILGLYLLICTYAAIGLFMSSLTGYQVVAAISTLAVLAALKFIGQIGQSIDFVREITYWISIEGRVDNFINGLISSKDVIYFLLVISLFLILTVMKLNSGRIVRTLPVIIYRYSILIIAVLLIGYISSLPSFTNFYDTTRFKNRTLTQGTRKILKELKKPVTLASYVNIINAYAHVGSPQFRIFDRNQFEQYLRYLPGMKIKYIPYYDSTPFNNDKSKSLKERAIRASTAYGFDFENVLSPSEIKNVINLVPEENRFVRMVEYDGKSTPLRMFSDMYVYPHEAEITAAFKRLLTKPATIGVVSGNDERSVIKTGDHAYQNIMTSVGTRSSLVNNGFNIIIVDVNEITKIPDNLSALVIADPMRPYSKGFLEKLDMYLNKGGNLMVAGEPGKQNLLTPIVKRFGVSFSEGMLLEESKNFAPDLLQLQPEFGNGDGFTFPKKAIVSMPGAVGLKYDSSGNYNITPILFTNKKFVWNKTGKFDVESDKVVFNPKSDKKIRVPVALALSKKVSNKEQKIMILGDADFMSNSELSRQNMQTVNPEFTLKIFKWFSNGEYPVEITRPDPIDNKIKITERGVGWMKILLIGILPLCIGLSGGLILISRKRK